MIDLWAVPTESGRMNEPRAGQMRELLRDAAGYWERRRTLFNLTLAAVVLAWVALTWPHFRDALTPHSFFLLLILALAANACYSLVYLVDIPIQRSSFASSWRRIRRPVWLLVTALAILATNYWIAAGVYPYVGQ